MNQPKILVVDDDKEIVGAIKKRLEMEDYEIITAYDPGTIYGSRRLYQQTIPPR